MDNNINGMTPEKFQDSSDNNIIMNNENLDDLTVNSNNADANSNSNDNYDDLGNINGFVNSDEFNDMENFALNGNEGNNANDNNAVNPGITENAGSPDLFDSNNKNDKNKANRANKTNANLKEKTNKNKTKQNPFSISGFINSVKEFWLNLSRRTKILTGVSAAIGIVLIIALVAVLNTSPYVTTYTRLDDQEAGEIMNILDSYNVKYNWDNTLKTLSLRERDQAAAVAALAMEGYPRIGRLAYEPSSGGGLFETKDDKQKRYNQDLENKLAAAVGTMNGIDAAIVTLSLPDNSRNTLTQDQQPAKASVLLHIKPGYSLSRETVMSIENLIEKSVENLSVENISVSDSAGKILNNYSDDTSMMTLVDIKKKYQLEQENYINQKVIELLGAPFGLDGIRVASTVTADFNKLVEEAKNYYGINVDEDTGVQSGLPVARATDRTISSSSDPNAMGAAGTNLNIDADGYYEAPVDPESGDFADDYHFTEELVVNYVISQMERTSPEITDVSLAVFLDADIVLDFDDYDPDEMIRALATATGINSVAMRNLPPDTALDAEYYGNYISIISLPFPKPDEPYENEMQFETIFDLTPFQFLLAVGAGLIVIIIIIIILIILANNRSRRRMESDEDAYAGQTVLAGEGGGLDLSSLGLAAAKHAVASERNDIEDDFMPIEAKEQMLKRQIKMFTTQNPEIAAQLIRTLMKGEVK